MTTFMSEDKKYKACEKLASFLEKNYPSICLIPTNEHKRPTYAFKGKSCDELWDKWYGDYGWFRYVCANEKAGVSLLLRDDLIVVDCDDITEAEEFEQCIPEFTKTPKQATKKGCHYFFKRGKICDENNIFCSIRPFEKLSVDIITKRQEGKEAGMISIYPSPNKQWIRSIFDTEILELPQSFVDFYKAKCKYPNKGSRKQDEPEDEPQAESKDDVQETEANTTIDYETLKEIVANLSDKRADGYNDWTTILWGIYNIARNNGYIKKGKNLIHEFSARSFKYNEDEVEEYIDNASNRNGGVGLGTLMMMLKEDNEVMFHNIQAKLNPVKKVELNGYSFIEEPPFNMFDGTIREYDVVKQVFEMRHFKVMRPLLYVEVLQDGECYLRDMKTLKDTFTNVYCNVLIEKAGIQSIEEKKFILEWIKDPKIRTYETIDFLPPPLKCPPTTFNMWRGFAIEHQEVESSGNIEPFMEHSRILVNHDEKSLWYLHCFLAQIAQCPGETVGTALLFKSEQGAGKNVFIEFLTKMFGEDICYETANPVQDLWSRFSLGRKNRLLINIDETSGKDTYQFAEQLKNMITSKTLNYEKKGIDPITLRNFNRLLFTTNNPNSLKIEQGDRRYAVFECSNEKKGNKAYFDELVNYFNKPSNQKAVFEYLQGLDISNVDWINDRPITELYRNIQETSLPVHIKFFMYMYENNSIEYTMKFTPHDFYQYFKQTMMSNGHSVDGITNTKLIMSIKHFVKVGANGDFENDEFIRKVNANKGFLYRVCMKDVKRVLLQKGYIKETICMIQDFDD